MESGSSGLTCLPQRTAEAPTPPSRNGREGYCGLVEQAQESPLLRRKGGQETTWKIRNPAGGAPVVAGKRTAISYEHSAVQGLPEKHDPIASLATEPIDLGLQTMLQDVPGDLRCLAEVVVRDEETVGHRPRNLLRIAAQTIREFTSRLHLAWKPFGGPLYDHQRVHW